MQCNKTFCSFLKLEHLLLQFLIGISIVECKFSTISNFEPQQTCLIIIFSQQFNQIQIMNVSFCLHFLCGCTVAFYYFIRSIKKTIQLNCVQSI